MRHCPHCNTKLKKKNQFCPGCGTPIVRSENDYIRKDCLSEGDSTIRHNKKTAIVIIVLVVLSIAVGVFVAINGIGSWADIFGSNETTQPATPFSDDPTAISAASQSVVMLNCYDKSGELYATGSGFACFADNVIVTNFHVIEGGVYSIEASTESGRSFDITHILATDKDKDIAILSTSTNHNLDLLQPRNGNALQKGEKVVAIGSPLGLLNSVSTGVFSGYVAENSMDVLQFTASISSGSSGGALFNDLGEVLGITYASYEAGQNLNLAIPIEQVERLWNSRSVSNIMTVAEFFDAQIPVYSVNYVIANYESLQDQRFYIDCYASTFDISSGYSWIYCVNSANEVYYPSASADEFDAYNYDRNRSLKGEIIRVNYWYPTDGFTYVRPPSVSLGDHLLILCVGIDPPLWFEGEYITSPALIGSNIKVVE